MHLSELLDRLPQELAPRRAALGDDPVVRAVTYDSRLVTPGSLFVALRGENFDGHDYLEEALRLGAVALLVESSGVATDRPVVELPDTRRALAPIATAFYGDPAHELSLIGVTGTNGKTSVTFLVESILKTAGQSVGVIGTVDVRYAGERVRAVNTTPESLDLQRTLRAMCTSGVDAVVMEVSSHGLALGRVEGCAFRVVAFTNASQDHLDFHGDMDRYVDAKLGLFREHVAREAAAVVNVDDPRAETFLAAARANGSRIIRVTRRPGAEAEVCVESAQVELDGTRARLVLPQGPIDLELPLIGDFNVENLAVAVGIAVALGVNAAHIERGVRDCPQVPGRTERVQVGDGPTVLVDYAHTPDAVDKLLRTVRPLAGERLITVFGCGGDRDRTKRPLMAEAVARFSDRTVATSDNPRTEDPSAILADVEKGLGSLQRVTPGELDASAGAYTVVEDRREAIELAIGLAGPRDTVVLAGKGHEDYQIIGREKLPFDDREEAARALRARASAQGGAEA